MSITYHKKVLLLKMVLMQLVAVPFLIPSIVLAQPAGAGASPDDELNNPVVPFNNINIVFLLVGIVFAVLVYKRLQKTKEKVHK